MKTLRKVVDTALDWSMVVMFIVIFVIVLVQIWYRYVLESPLVWTEESSRFIFIWVSLMGWVLATRSRTHICITFFQERLPAPVQKFLQILFELCTIAFLAVLAYLGLKMLGQPPVRRSAVTIPFLSMRVVYFALPVSAILGIFYTVLNLIDPPVATAAPAEAETEGTPQ